MTPFKNALKVLGNSLPLMLFLAGFYGGITLLLDNWGGTNNEKLFIKTPEFLVWVVLVSILFAILPLCFIYGCLSFRELNWSILKKVEYLIPFLISLSTLVFMFFLPSIIMYKFREGTPDYDLDSFQFKVRLVVFFSGIGVLPAIINLAFLNSYIKKICPRKDNFLEEYFKVKKKLEVLIGIVGLIIGLGTLATGGLQNALTVFLKASENIEQLPFPRIFTIVYGGYFTTILIALYLNLERSLVKLAESFIKRHINLPRLSDKSWAETYEKRKQVEEWLGLTSPWINIKSILLVFTPLIGGLISYIIPK